MVSNDLRFLLPTRNLSLEGLYLHLPGQVDAGRNYGQFYVYVFIIIYVFNPFSGFYFDCLVESSFFDPCQGSFGPVLADPL